LWPDFKIEEMKIGLYFGSFNPIHHGHLIIASHLLQNTDLDQVWFIVSPQNPLKKISSLLNEYQRLHLVRLAVEDFVGFKVVDVEFRLPRPSYTYDTMKELLALYPSYEFCLIMGSDSFRNLKNWKNSEKIKAEYPIYIYKRPNFDVSYIEEPHIKVLDAPLLEISSSLVRSLLSKGETIRYYVPETVREEIEKGMYYK
jgi:nicotinate-nucleotide adenylyltransferase